MDNATITLSNNKKINLSNTILLMTANIGVVTSKSMGLNESKSFLTVNKEEVKKVFPPEFLGRLNGIIEFNKLENSTVAKIVGKFIREFNTKLDSVHKAHIEMSTKAVNHLIDIGYSSFFGARTIKNALNQSVFLKVARMVCDQNNISKFSVDYNSELTFDVDYHKEEPKVEEKLTQKEIADSFPEVDYDRSTEQVKEEIKDQTTVKFTKKLLFFSRMKECFT
jgi:ATP-dependent Clp protease ATP-binding subunit ClpA